MHRIIQTTSLLRRRLVALVAVALLAGGAALPTAAAAQDYQLGPSDRIRVRVIEWRGSQAEWVEWPAAGGEFSVGVNGSVLLPLIGEITTQGQTTADIAARIAGDLQIRLGMATRPNATVEIVQYRPIYVVGEVERPGEFAFRPGMTVIQAISLAGGRYRLNEASLLRLERDWISSAGSFEAARQERRRLLSRLARLEAELAERETIEMPAELREETDAARLIADEASILVSRRQALTSALTGLRNLRELYEREVASLTQKIETQQRQIAIARRELQGVSQLRGQGLASAPRESALERVIADLEGRLLDFETAILRARQEGNKAARDAEDLVTRRRAEIATEMQATKAGIEQTAVRIATARSLMNEASVTAPAAANDRFDRAGMPIGFTILRRAGGGTQQIGADEMTPVLPGDVVRVSIAGAQLTERPSGGAASGRALSALPTTNLTQR